jgi:hypothetical protein
MRTWLLAAAAALATALPGFAGAAVSAAEIGDPHGDGLGEIGAQLRGGIAGYTGALGSLTNVGTEFGIQATARPLSFFGFEVAFDAARNAIDDSRLRAPGRISRNGLQGLAKLYAPIGQVQPYVGAGIGASVLSPSGNASESGLYSTDLVAEVPLAGGVEYHYKNLDAGVRLTYDAMLGQSIADRAVGSNAGGGLWEGSVLVGATF